MVKEVDIIFVGIGNLGSIFFLYVDGFIDDEEMVYLFEVGVVGEIISWIYNCEGVIVDCKINKWVISSELLLLNSRLVVGIVLGMNKWDVILGVFCFKLINVFIINEIIVVVLLEN